MRWRIGYRVFVRVFAAAIIVGNASSGAADDTEDTIRWLVDLRDAASGRVVVEATIPRSALPDEDVIRVLFRDVVPDRGGTIENLTIADGTGAPRPVECAAGGRGLSCAVAIPATATGLILRYAVDPTYFPPGSVRAVQADARSRATGRLAVLRTTSVFPAGDLVRSDGRVSFRLPDAWEIAWPWSHPERGPYLPPEALRSVEYIVAGPLELETLHLEGMNVHLARIVDTGEIALDEIGSLLRGYVERLGPPVSPRSDYLIALVPDAFMFGGAAGNHTAVQPPNRHTLAHELFHWWNRGGSFAVDARWFAEGFTEYVALEVAASTGFLAPGFRLAVLADLQEEMFYLERERIRSLSDCSRAAATDPQANRLIYSKGALFAHALRSSLGSDGRALIEYVEHVIRHLDRPVDSVALQAAARDRFGDVLNEAFDRHVWGSEPLPREFFGPARGDTGAARFFPPERSN